MIKQQFETVSVNGSGAMALTSYISGLDLSVKECSLCFADRTQETKETVWRTNERDQQEFADLGSDRSL